TRRSGLSRFDRRSLAVNPGVARARKAVASRHFARLPRRPRRIIFARAQSHPDGHWSPDQSCRGKLPVSSAKIAEEWRNEKPNGECEVQRGEAVRHIRRGCLRPMNYQIAINLDARFIALQDHCCCDNVFAPVQARACRSETDPRPLWGRTSSDPRGQAKSGNAEEI